MLGAPTKLGKHQGSKARNIFRKSPDPATADIARREESVRVILQDRPLLTLQVSEDRKVLPTPEELAEALLSSAETPVAS